MLDNKFALFRLLSQGEKIFLVSKVPQMKTRISPKSAKPSAFWSRRLSRPSKLAKPAVLEFGRESNKF